MKKFIFGLLALTLSSPIFAFEVGEGAPCVVLSGIGINGEATSGCIRDAVKPGQQFTLLEFFSIANAASQADLGGLSRLSDDLDKNATVRVIAIDADIDAVKAYLRAPAQKALVNFPVAFDFQQEASTTYDANAVPVQYILNRKNRVVYKHTGSLTQTEIEKIRQLILK